MKTKVIASLLTVLTGYSFSSAQSKFIPEDDIYYQPDETNQVVETRKAAQKQTSRTTLYIPSNTNVETSSDSRSVDEYNRRYTPEYQEDQQSYTEPQEDTVYLENVTNSQPAEEGYYLNGFNGSSSDYEYAERIRKFHNPKFTIHISDPAYTDIYFLNSSDWNIYIDNNYAWVTPTWTNPWSWNYMWAPYSYTSLSWRWGGWGYSSWNWGWNNWGFGWGGFDPFWNSCYPYWGYHYGHHYPHWGNGGYYPNWNKPNYRPRPNTSPRNPYYGRTNGSSSDKRRPAYINTRPSNNQTNISTRPAGNNTRPAGNVRPAGNSNIRPTGTTRPAGNNTRPAGNIRPSENTRPAYNNGNVTRPSRNPGTVTRPAGTTRPANSGRPAAVERPSNNNSFDQPSYSRPSSPSRSSGMGSGSSSYGGSRSSGSSGGGRGGRR